MIHKTDENKNEDVCFVPEEPPEEQWENDRENRETWSGKLDFILSGIGYAVGLGNIWRFPYLCAKNGGGAFLIPYCIFLVLCGIPLCVMEMSLGQFVSLCPTALFQKFCPLFQGIGWSQVLASAIFVVYFNIIIGWSFYFLILSLRSSLMWASCGNWWNTVNCVSGIKDLATNQSLLNETAPKMTASEEFWQHYVLRISESSGIGDLGSFEWQLVASHAVSWILVFLCLFKGVHTSGKVVYITATFPYAVLVVLIGRGITLPGAMDGLKYYFIPKWEKLLDLDVWSTAALQIFFSVGPAWGAMITFASFNKFNHKVYRDALIIPLVNCGTSIFAGVAVFSIIGYMAKEAGRDVGDIILGGPGLAFSVYPEVLAKFPLAPLWSVLFFTMIITVGLDSQFGSVETVVMAFVDTWPGILRKRKTLVTGFLCLLAFMLGLPLTTQGGMYVFQLIDWYCALLVLMLVSAIECLLLSYNYGIQRFMADLYMMNNRYPSKWLICAWAFVTPAVVIFLMIANFVKHTPVTYEKYKYPDWAITIGWCIAIYSSLPIPIYMVLNVCWRRRHLPSLWDRIVDAMRPAPDWGPSRLDDRALYCKSLNQVPSKQLYVKGVERQVEMVLVTNNNMMGYKPNESDSVPLKSDNMLEKW